MQIQPLSVPDAWQVTPTVHTDARGSFLEAFRADALAQVTGRPFTVAQANTSVSAAGTVRGVHFAELPPSQAKYVMCVRGAVLDFVVDIRVGSPTFGQWDSVLLDDRDRRAVYISEGLGHAFCSLEDGSTVSYLCSAPYTPGREHGVRPTCATLGLRWPTTGRDGAPLGLLMSDRDAGAPDLMEAASAGILPRYAEVRRYLDETAQRQSLTRR